MHSAVAHASVMVKIYLRFKNFPINFTNLFSIVSVIGKINHGYKKKEIKIKLASKILILLLQFQYQVIGHTCKI